jgi:predicted AAA+ superfamily ATPase
MAFIRPQSSVLSRRLRESRRFIQVVSGPRQVGKTTMVRQVMEASRTGARFASADEPTLRGRDWIEQQWDAARLEAGNAGKRGAALILDEIQKIPNWSETVKRLWDEDTHSGSSLKVVVLGSAPLLISRGLTESLAGRFELLHLPHWSYSEMKSAFAWRLPRICAADKGRTALEALCTRFTDRNDDIARRPPALACR